MPGMFNTTDCPLVPSHRPTLSHAGQSNTLGFSHALGNSNDLLMESFARVVFAFGSSTDMDLVSWIDVALLLKIALVLGTLAFAASVFIDYQLWLAFAQGDPPGHDNFHHYALLQLRSWTLKLRRIPYVSVLVQDSDEVPDLDETFFGWNIQKNDSVASDASLPPHPRARPQMAPWLFPQRTLLRELPEPQVYIGLMSLFTDIIEVYQRSCYRFGLPMDALQCGPSRIEGHSAALQVSAAVSEAKLHPVTSRMRCEIAHIHSGHDLSFHVMLSESDAATVVKAGWGELFPLAGRTIWTGQHRGMLGPMNLVFLYPPKTTEELEIVRFIIMAGVGFALSPLRASEPSTSNTDQYDAGAAETRPETLTLARRIGS